MKAGLRAIVLDTGLVAGIALVRKCISCVVQNDVEYDKKILLVGGIDKLPQFIVGARGVVGESRLRSQKVVDAVTVIGALVKWQILKHRAKPDRASPKLLDIAKLLLDSRKVSSLETEESAVVKGIVLWRCGTVIEPIHHEEVDPAVTPVFGGGEGCGGRTRRVDRLVEDSLEIRREERVWQAQLPTAIATRVLVRFVER